MRVRPTKRQITCTNREIGYGAKTMTREIALCISENEIACMAVEKCNYSVETKLEIVQLVYRSLA